MNTTIKESLHDKWLASDWHQLWADDNKAFILIPVKSVARYAVVHNYLVVTDNGSDITAVELPFSEAIDEWNTQINEHLAN